MRSVGRPPSWSFRFSLFPLSPSPPLTVPSGKTSLVGQEKGQTPSMGSWIPPTRGTRWDRRRSMGGKNRTNASMHPTTRRTDGWRKPWMDPSRPPPRRWSAIQTEEGWRRIRDTKRTHPCLVVHATSVWKRRIDQRQARDLNSSHPRNKHVVHGRRRHAHGSCPVDGIHPRDLRRWEPPRWTKRSTKRRHAVPQCHRYAQRIAEVFEPSSSSVTCGGAPPPFLGKCLPSKSSKEVAGGEPWFGRDVDPFSTRFFLPSFSFPWDGASVPGFDLSPPMDGVGPLVFPSLRIHPQSFGFSPPIERKESIRFDRSVRRWYPPPMLLAHPYPVGRASTLSHISALKPTTRFTRCV